MDNTGKNFRHTKIVATLGPASSGREQIAALIRAGVNLFRLNFSHGTYEDHEQLLNSIRSCAKELSAIVGILQDLSGPKIRIGMVSDTQAQLVDDQIVLLKLANGGLSNAQQIEVEAVDPTRLLRPGQRVLLADGIIELVAEAVEGGVVRCRTIRGGHLRSRVGIAFPDSLVALPATTDKDMRDLEWGIAHQVDYVAVSFVQSAADIERVRAATRRGPSPAKIIAKIEHKLAITNFDAILAASDGIMVARGDLGVEFPVERLPLLQRHLVRAAVAEGKPVIVATQLLHSMVTAVRPTRAEVTDVATAVVEGADAVMLSEETAIGKHPSLAVGFLDKIARTIEAEWGLTGAAPPPATDEIPNAVAYSACAAAQSLRIPMVVCTDTGESARLVSKYRPQQPLWAVSSDRATLQRLTLQWGVIPLSVEPATNRDQEIEVAVDAVATAGALPSGSNVIVTYGLAIDASDTTCIMEVKAVR